MRRPLSETGLGLSAEVERESAEAPGQTSLVVRIDPRGVTLEKRGDRFVGTVDLLIGQGLPNGTVTDAYLTLDLHLTAEQRERIATEGILLRRQIRLRDDAHQISIVARDLPSGAIGSLAIPADKARAAARQQQ